MPYLLFLKKQQNLILWSAANCRWRFKGKLIFLECGHFLFCMCELTLWTLHPYNGVFVIKMYPADPCIKLYVWNSQRRLKNPR